MEIALTNYLCRRQNQYIYTQNITLHQPESHKIAPSVSGPVERAQHRRVRVVNFYYNTP